jgi:hypothetical protein
MIVLPYISWKSWLAAISYYLLGCPSFEEGWRWALHRPVWLMGTDDSFAPERASWAYENRRGLGWRAFYRLFTPSPLREWRENVRQTAEVPND